MDQCHHWAWIVTIQCVTKPSILLTEAEDLQAAAGFRAAARVLSLNHAA
jgi:hypothetical protein